MDCVQLMNDEHMISGADNGLVNYVLAYCFVVYNTFWMHLEKDCAYIWIGSFSLKNYKKNTDQVFMNNIII